MATPPVHAVTIPGAAYETPKKRKTTVTQLHTGVDNRLASSSGNTRTYINNMLGGDVNDDLASLVAEMLRDGDLQLALERKKTASVTKLLGRMIPMNKKGSTRWKMLGRRFDRTIVDNMAGAPLFTSDDASLKFANAKRYSHIVGMALNQAEGTEVPHSHDCARFEQPLVCVCMVRYKDCGERLKGITKESLLTLAYFYYAPGTNKMVTAPWFLTVDQFIELPITNQELITFDDFVLENTHSIKQARVHSVKGGRIYYILPLLKAQYPAVVIIDEDEPFQYPNAAARFKDATPPAPQRALASAPASTRASDFASPAEISSAGLPSDVSDAEVPV